ncbi:MAG: alkyl hydroperoxide reductase/Thiol specific antioxidant/Mal allergen [Myxococcales bacterium]|nr:alkyl hydroperoxide reductase/Thiol specific antioxidant/Mal allergen [Myxococcales bacterium]
MTDGPGISRGEPPGPGGPHDAGPRFFARLGLAITNPRWALSIAADRRHAGRSGTDLLVLMLVILAATQLRGLVGAVWLGTAVDPALGLRFAIHVLTRALSVKLGFLVVAAIIVWLASGSRRDLGRSFDLACVAALPILIVDLIASVIVQAFDLAPPDLAAILLAGVSFMWAGVLIALSLRPARQRAVTVPAPPPAIERVARNGGRAVIAAAVIGVVLQVVGIVRNTELIRPMTQGDPAPAFSLPTIAAGGEHGEPVSLPSMRGNVVVLDFWATWCNPCLKMMPSLDALARAHPELVVLAINLDDPAAARGLWDERGYQLQLLADDGQVSDRYGVTTIPHSVVIDRAGVVRAVIRGSSSELDSTVIRLLAEEIRK